MRVCEIEECEFAVSAEKKNVNLPFLAIRLWKSRSENCMLQNRTNEMYWGWKTNSKNNTKIFDQFTNATQHKQPFYAKNAHLKVANLD